MAEESEVRIALICYGGVSLAIYMHGITKELHKLIKASRAFDRDLRRNPFRDKVGNPADTEAVYFDALQRFADNGRPLSVSIDIIGGTSAGGINGVVLAKAIAKNLNQDQLKRLWIDQADLKTLFRAPAIGGVAFRALYAAATKVATFWTRSAPLKGGLMSRLLYRALSGMDNPPAPADVETLIPRGGELSLFVTTTDLNGFEVAFPSADGGVGQRDRCYAQVLDFRQDTDGGAAFDAQATPTLTFAARATSAFPGAFEPVSPQSFPTEAHFPSGEIVDTDRFRYSYAENGGDAAQAWFVDGGVLDNAPFDIVIDAISRRRAASQVHRRLVYIEPDPGRPLEAPPDIGNARRAQKRSWAADVKKVLTTVRTSHPIVNELIRLREINETIAQVGAIADQQRVEVLDTVRNAVESSLGITNVGPTSSKDVAAAIESMPPMDDVFASKDKLLEISDRMHADAARALGPTWNTYQRLKAEETAKNLARALAKKFALPPESGTAVFIRSATAAWIRRQDSWSEIDPTALSDFLRPIDTPYRHRRMLFILAGLNKLYKEPDPPPRADIDALKDSAWKQIESNLAAPGGAIAALDDEGVLDFLRPDGLKQARFSSAEGFAEAKHADFQKLFLAYAEWMKDPAHLGDGGAPLWQAFTDHTRDWDKKHRVLLLNRYLGFPLWDGLLFPTISLSDLPQYTTIPTEQFSPLRAEKLQPPDGRAKLDGVRLRHFGAFLEEKYRENDYLWGRLDGVELILKMLDEAVPDIGARASDLDLQAFTAVLDTETDLKRVGKLTRHLRERIRSETDRAAAAGPPSISESPAAATRT